MDDRPEPSESMSQLQFRAGPPLGIGYTGTLTEPMQATDFRVLLPRLVEEYSARGGRMVLAPGVDAATVLRRAEDHELTVVAVGRASIGELFPVDRQRSPYTEPQRIVVGGLFAGLALPEPHAVSFNLSPTAGSAFQMVMRTPYGLGTNLLINAIPGGPLSALADASPADPGFVPTLVALLREHAPAVAARIQPKEFALTQPNDWVSAAITPVVRRGWHQAGSGKVVVAIGDAWITNDPITGQGANLGSYCAWTAADYIAAGGPYDAGFATRLEAAMWAYAGPVTEFTNAFLQPPPPHVIDLMCAAAAHQRVRGSLREPLQRPARHVADPRLTADRRRVRGRQPRRRDRSWPGRRLAPLAMRGLDIRTAYGCRCAGRRAPSGCGLLLGIRRSRAARRFDNPQRGTMTTTSCNDTGRAGYLLGNADPEVRRLVDQARLFERELAWLFAGLDAAPGGAAIDIGCGPIGILPTLARHVGPAGRVVGVDRDPVMLTHAAAECGERGLVNVELVQGDACSTGLASGSFDLAHVRLVLVNVADPAAVVAEAVRHVRPGGLVVLQEVDWLSWQCEPAHAAWDELQGLLRRLWASRGFDPCIGRRLPRLLADAGVVDISAVAGTPASTAGTSPTSG